MNTTSPPRSVIVGIDGSQAAIRAAEWAIDEAVSREIPLRLIHVIHDHVEPAPTASVGNVQMEVEYGETALRKACAAVATSGKPVKVETGILQGDPAKTLIAESRDAEMICVGSVGIGRFARALLGSTAAELAEAAHSPVAIIRTQQTEPKPGSVVIAVAVNDSPGNDDVVRHAMEEAELRHAPVLALGAWREDLGDMPYDDLHRRMQFWSQRYPGVTVHAAATHTGISDFLAFSDRRVQLAVIGSTDADQVPLLIGPHSHPILGHAECSVLIVRS
ncbi:universal stress protein [uncultured Mycobacterium sp.]|uniref:universal stress protein n=1 Tax=uncultured Mycobacterium sp. TaxID=171292 RepID=UPI0035CAB086